MNQSEIDKMYIEKSEFVEKMQAALTMLPGVDAVEYKHVWDKYSEFVRVTYEDGSKTYINVTGDSLWAIAVEIGRFVTMPDSVVLDNNAEITNDIHQAIIDGWFEN